jgi:hypothetical protein
MELPPRSLTLSPGPDRIESKCEIHGTGQEMAFLLGAPDLRIGEALSSIGRNVKDGNGDCRIAGSKKDMRNVGFERGCMEIGLVKRSESGKCGMRSEFTNRDSRPDVRYKH